MNAPECGARAGRFRRYFLPGLAFKAVIIGGGYATGRELAEFFLPSGSWGGLLGIIVAAAVCSGVCILTFVLARRSMSFDYRSLFRELLGRFWFLFEILYLLQLVIGLAVFGSAAGAIGHALLGWPDIAGTLTLVCLIAGFLAFGNPSVEQLFKYVSILLYATYGIFLVLGFTHFGEKTVSAFATFRPGSAWVVGGLTYAGYNLIGAIAALPTVRHMTSDLDAVKAGILVGPLAMVPAALFFVCMAAWPEVGSQTLPSDFLLDRMHLPPFRFAYQAMIFAALLESGTGIVHALNERIAGSLKNHARFTWHWRLGIGLIVLTGSVFLAVRFGLVALIAKGYRWLSLGYLLFYISPLLTVGIYRLWRGRQMPLIHRISVRNGALTSGDDYG